MKGLYKRKRLAELEEQGRASQEEQDRFLKAGLRYLSNGNWKSIEQIVKLYLDEEGYKTDEIDRLRRSDKSINF